MVTRFPLMRTDAIKVFRSVTARGDKGSVLGRYFGSTDGGGSLGGFGGGVVVFSTQRSSDCDGSSTGGGSGGLPRVPSCPVACMGGDYDGDMYVRYCDRRDPLY